MLAAAFGIFLLHFYLCYGNPSILFSTSKDIRIANLSRPAKVTTIFKDLSGATAFDFYYAGKMVCWADKDMIQCVSHNGTHSSQKVSIITSDVISPDGLACDWLTQKLYWTDGEKNRLEVASMDGKYRKVLLWEDIDLPKAIALVPDDSLMFWTDWGEMPKIERASMDGDSSTRTVIVSNKIFWPNGITIDYENKKIYWLDGRLGFIETMDYDGKNRRTILENKDKRDKDTRVIIYPQALAFFNNKLYWTDWDTWSVHMLDLLSSNSGIMSSSRELIHLSDQIPIDVRVMDSSRQPSKNVPCQINNGGCSHLCLLSSKSPGYTCACPTGVKLIDEFTCNNGSQNLLLLVQTNDISWISLDSPDHTTFIIPLRGIKHAMSIDFDPINRLIYWTDNENNKIRCANLNTTGQHEEVTSSELPDGVAVDWRAQNLYWTDPVIDRIQVIRLRTKYTKVLINTELSEPRAIAVSPDEGLMFWSDWDKKRPKIESAALDGSDRSLLVTEKLGWPNGIALDIPKKKLYWCDAKTDRIEVIGYDGKDRREIITDNVPHVFGLTLLGDYLYWTDWQKRTIDSAHKTTGLNRKLIVDQVPNMMGIKAVGPLPPVKTHNPCSVDNGNCDHLCLNTPSKYVCACEMGYELASNRRSCVIPEAFLLFAQKENIGRISIENAHNDAFIPISGVKDTSSLDFDIDENRIYWSDIKGKIITRSFVNGSHVEKLIEFGLESPEGLAVDWIAHNIYWTDTGTKRIEVASSDGKFRKTIIWTDLQEPRSIAVDPTQHGNIYWSDWFGDGSLHKANLDGSNPKIMISNLGRVNSLTLDLPEKRIYWCAIQGFIESSALDGMKRTTVATSPRPFTMSLYREKIYWSDWQTGGLYSADKHTGSNQTILHQKLEQVTSVVVYHGWSQTGWGECSKHNCPYLCLAGRCQCPTHYRYSNDNKCLPPVTFILVSTRNSISRIVVNTTDCTDAPLPIQGLKNVRSIDYDPVHKAVYWIDGRTHTIKRSTTQTHSTVAIPSVQSPTSLALDSQRRILFWSSNTEGVINATRLDNSSSDPIIIIKANHSISEKFKQITIHEGQGLIFWVSIIRDTTNIFKSRMDGVRRKTLVNKLQIVTALAVDPKGDMLYWVTGKAIGSVHFSGRDRRMIRSANFMKTVSAAVLGNSFFWIHTQNVEYFNLNTGKRGNILKTNQHLTSIISVVSTSSKEPISPVWECVTGEITSSPLDCIKRKTGPCGPGLFACVDSVGDCIPSKWLCDGFTDCIDGSDEQECRNPGKGFFTCYRGKAIPENLLCDGTTDCPDGDDEINCCVARCNSSNTCIPKSALCDGWTQCSDGSDEWPEVCSIGNPAAFSLANFPDILVILGCLTLIIVVIGVVWYIFIKRKSRMSPTTDHALDPLAPNPVLRAGTAMRISSIHSHYHKGLGSVSLSNQPSSSPLLCYPINPPPSPVTTVKGNGSVSLHRNGVIYRPPPPTPCSSTAIDTDSTTYIQSEPNPPPPTPTSLSPSPSSSTYFHPVPPPSPTP